MDADISAAVPDRVQLRGLSAVMESGLQMKNEIFRTFFAESNSKYSSCLILCFLVL